MLTNTFSWSKVIWATLCSSLPTLKSSHIALGSRFRLKLVFNFNCFKRFSCYVPSFWNTSLSVWGRWDGSETVSSLRHELLSACHESFCGNSYYGSKIKHFAFRALAGLMRGKVWYSSSLLTMGFFHGIPKNCLHMACEKPAWMFSSVLSHLVLYRYLGFTRTRMVWPWLGPCWHTCLLKKQQIWSGVASILLSKFIVELSSYLLTPLHWKEACS